MDVLKQLGGYHNAKKFINGECADGFDVQNLRDALLEYRRANNIFEVGDKVIEITDYPSNDVLTVKSISDNLLVCESDDLNASYVLSNKYKPYFYVRHATDDEIEVQKILEKKNGFG